MKRLFKISFVFSALLLAQLNTFAGGTGCSGCAANVGACTGLLGALCPEIAPAANSGVPYSQDFTINIVAEVDAGAIAPQFAGFILPISDATITSVSGLPPGLNWECSNIQNGCVYNPTTTDTASQFACIRVCGTPCSPSDSFFVSVVVTFTVTIPGVGSLPIPIPMGFTLPVVSASPKLEIASESRFLCPGAPGDNLDLDATTGFVSYQWSTGSTTESINVISADTYSVTVIDNVGCQQEAAVDIAVLGFATTVTTDTTICENTIIQLNATGGDFFEWSPGENLNDSTSGSPVITGLTNSTTYSVTVSNNNCSDQTSMEVTIDNTECATLCGTCTPAPNLCTTNNTPSVCEDIADFIGGVPYSDNMTVYFPSVIEVQNVFPIPVQVNIPGIPEQAAVKYVIVEGIDGLPAGLNWDCDQVGNDCKYFPGLEPSITQFACISICGTTCGNNRPDTVTMELQLNVLLDLSQDVIDLINNIESFDGHVSYSVPFSNLITFQNEFSITPAGPITINQGESVMLNASTTGFSNHLWGNGTQGASITVNTSGTYTVQASDGTCTRTATVQVLVLVGIEDVDAIESSLVIYPNPNQGICEVSFDLKNNREVTIEVFTIQGQRVLTLNENASFGRNSYTLNLQGLSKGTYFARVSTEEGAVNRKITVY